MMRIKSDQIYSLGPGIGWSLVSSSLILSAGIAGGGGGGTNGSIGGSPEVIAPSFVSDDAHKISWQLAEKCRARICYDAVLRRIPLQFPKAASL